MPIGDSTMAAVPTTGDDIRWEDIVQWMTQDPITKQWSIKGGYTATDIAGYLNADFRHYNDTRIEEIFRVCFTELEMIFRDVGLQTDPVNDEFQWRGIWDQHHRELPDSGQRNQLVRKGWNRALTKGQESKAIIPCVPDYPPQETQQSDRAQQGGLVLAEWSEISQDINDGTYTHLDFPYSPPQDYPDPQSVHDLWVTLTGGRRFGACTDTSVNQAITDQNAIESRNEAFAGTQDVRAKSAAAVEAADAEYRDNPNATRASVNTAGDNAYNA